MSTRRQFLRTATASLAAFTLPLASAAAGARAAGADGAPSRIDWHAHWIGPTVVGRLAGRTSPWAPPTTV